MAADYARARACVNALAGIEDPAAYLYQQKADLEMLAKALNDLLESHAPYHSDHARRWGELSLPMSVAEARAALSSVGKLNKP